MRHDFAFVARFDPLQLILQLRAFDAGQLVGRQRARARGPPAGDDFAGGRGLVAACVAGGVVGVAVGIALLPLLSRQLRAGNKAAAHDSQNRAIELSMLLSVPAAMALIAISEPIVIVLFQRGAFDQASDQTAFPEQLTNGLKPHAPQRLFYSARPKGFRLEWANRLRAAGEDFPLPATEQLTHGNPPEEIHLTLDLSAHLETKMACILCHRTQVAPSWPYHRVPREVAEWVMGREYYIRARPDVSLGEKISKDIFHGISPD